LSESDQTVVKAMVDDEAGGKVQTAKQKGGNNRGTRRAGGSEDPV
jgi:hypothetical protein